VSYLLSEIALRVGKLVAASIVGVVVYLFAVGPLAATPSVELGLLAWLAGAATVLLVESGLF
jgi:hypothetical protein